MSDLKTISAKFPPKLINKVDEWAEREGISRSNAVRRLVRDGLENKDRQTVFLASLVAATAFIAISLMDSTEGGYVVGGSFIGAMLLWSSWPGLKATLLP